MSPPRNKYFLHPIITPLLFLSILIFTIFLFNKRAFEPTLSLYIDLFSHPPPPPPPPLSSPTNSHVSLPSAPPTHPPISPISQNNLSVEDGQDPIEKNRSFSEMDSNGGDLSPISQNHFSVEDGQDPVEKNQSFVEMDGNGGDSSSLAGVEVSECDLFMGTWVKDEEYPIYKAGSCPYVDEAFDCQTNGRGDSNYLKWRWKPDGCDLPRYL